MPAAINLLERAIALRRDDDRSRLSELPLLGRALLEAGHWERARHVLTEASERGSAVGDKSAVAHATLELCFLKLHTETDVTHAEIESELAEAARAFDELGDEVGLARALTAAGRLPFWRGDMVASIDQEERAAAHARASGSRTQELEALTALLVAMTEGPPTVAEVRERVDQLAALTSGSSRPDVLLLRVRADTEAMLGNIGHAREYAADAKALAQELGLKILLATGIARTVAEIELSTGDFAAAECEVAPACDLLEEAEDWGHLVSLLPYLMDALYPQGRAEEVAARLDTAELRMIKDDHDAQVGIRRARAKLAAARGDLAAATILAREAVARGEGKTSILNHARALENLAEILQCDGRDIDAAEALGRAIEIYEHKGCTGLAGTARARLAAAQL
jgi:tetratricopeptide (TPR) repeat protein